MKADLADFPLTVILTTRPTFQVTVEVAGIFSESEEEIPNAWGGDNVRIRLRGVDDEDVSPGFVLTSIAAPVHAVRRFEAQLAILDSKNIICAGYSAVMHVHTLAEEVSLTVRSLIRMLGSVLCAEYSCWLRYAGIAALLRQKDGEEVEEAPTVCEEG